MNLQTKKYIWMTLFVIYCLCAVMSGITIPIIQGFGYAGIIIVGALVVITYIRWGLDAA